MDDLIKSSDENYYQYVWRVDNLIRQGKYKNWKEVTPIVNNYVEESDIKGESGHRSAVKYARDFYEAGVFDKISDDGYAKELQIQQEELRKERIKLQTANIERSRVDRSESRQEMYYEFIGSVMNPIPCPNFKPLNVYDGDTEYLCCISDIHYGAKFISENNEYSIKICEDRFNLLLSDLIDFIEKKQINKINIAELGDTIQGILRVSDLKLNETTIGKATVMVSKLIAKFLIDLSQYCIIDYYHVPFANHTQIRPIGTKASELADEDIEYVIGNYIKDLCKEDDRITVYLADEGKQYISMDIAGLEVVAMHGHTIKNIDTSLKDLGMVRRKFIDYLILGHFHNGKEIPSNEGVCNDTEILVCPSFIGSDPYSDSLMKGSKSAVKIYGFDNVYGHTETYKFILN